MGAGVRQFHLRLDARDLRDAKSRSLPSRVPQQRRLPNARLTMEHQDGAVTVVHICQQSVDKATLAVRPRKPNPGLAGISSQP